MALRIWCDPVYFHEDAQDSVVQTALAVLGVFGVTLEQAREVQAYTFYDVEDATDFEEDAEAEGEVHDDWEHAWLQAMATAGKVVGVERVPPGALLVLDESDMRFMQSGSGSTLQ